LYAFRIDTFDTIGVAVRAAGSAPVKSPPVAVMKKLHDEGYSLELGGIPVIQGPDRSPFDAMVSPNVLAEEMS
jgi:hypothetical protein